MPARFARLLPGSKLIDAGFNPPASATPNLAQLEADFPFLVSPVYGAARDLGPYELVQEELPTDVQQIIAPESKGEITVMGGNKDSECVVRFSVPTDMPSAQLTVYDISGRAVTSVALTRLTHGVDYYQPIDLSTVNGLFIVRLSSPSFSLATKGIK